MDAAWPESWVGPHWVERQRRGLEAGPVTRLGALAGPERVAVDERGYLSVDGASWGLDVWVGADDRWHAPSLEAAVRQSLVDGTPVVQTTLRVPGGDVHVRVGVAAAGGGSRCLVEVENASAAPVALAFAVRPATTSGVGRVGRVALDGTTVSVDDVAALLLPAPPRRAWAGGASSPDAFGAVTSGAAAEVTGPVAADCPEGLAGLVAVVPLAHRASYGLQVVVTPAAGAAPVGDGVAALIRGWAAQVGRLVRLELPDVGGLGALDAVRAMLLLASGGSSPHPEVVVAAATAGFGTADPQQVLDDASPERAGAALWAAGRLVGLGGAVPDAHVVRDLAERAGATASDDHERAATFAATAALLDAAGERRAARKVRRWAGEAGVDPRAFALPSPTGDGGSVADRAAAAVAAATMGERAWLAHLAAVAAAASPTLTWPAADAALVVARWWAAVRAALVDDSTSAAVGLLPGWLPELGRAPLEAHQLPSSAGLVSFALRWHDDRPALLWSVNGGPADLEVRAPGLDPAWRGRGPEGEALLAATGG